MPYPTRLLGEDEEVVVDLRPHWKALVVPVLALLLTVAVAGYLAGLLGAAGWQRAARWAVLGLAVVVVLRTSGWPFLRWWTTVYVVTTRRLIVRTGVFSRSGRDMPLSRVNDVHFEHNLVERLLGCGTLVVESAGERGQLVLDDVPAVEEVQREIYRLHEADDLRRRGRAPEPGSLSE